MTAKNDRDMAILYRSFLVTLSVLGMIGLIVGLWLVAGGETWGFVIIGTGGAALVAAVIWLVALRRGRNKK